MVQLYLTYFFARNRMLHCAKLHIVGAKLRNKNAQCCQILLLSLTSYSPCELKALSLQLSLQAHGWYIEPPFLRVLSLRAPPLIHDLLLVPDLLLRSQVRTYSADYITIPNYPNRVTLYIDSLKSDKMQADRCWG